MYLFLFKSYLLCLHVLYNTLKFTCLPTQILLRGLLDFFFFVSLLKKFDQNCGHVTCYYTCLHTWIMAIHRKKFTLQKSFRQEQEKLVDFLLTIWVNDYVKNDGRFLGKH